MKSDVQFERIELCCADVICAAATLLSAASVSAAAANVTVSRTQFDDDA